MKVDIKKLPKSEIEMLIEFDAQEWGKFVDQAVQQLSKEIKVEGFRPGNAPRQLLEQKIGQGKILEQAADLAVRQGYIKAIKENNVDVIGQPEIHVLKVAQGNPFEFKVKTAVLPEITLADYKEIAKADKPKKKDEIKVTEKEAEESLTWLQKSRTKYVTVLRPIQKGDRAELNFTAKKGDQIIEGGKSENHPVLVGEGKFVPGFEDQLIGLKENEEKKFSLVFPEDYKPADLSGQLIDFEIKVKLVQEPQVPELNDEFAKNVGNFENLAKLKETLSDNLAAEKEHKEKDVWRAKILEKIAKKPTMELPEVLVKTELDRMIEEFKNNVMQMGLDFGDYLKKLKKTEEELKKEWEIKAGERSRAGLVLSEIAKREMVAVAEQEIDAEITNMVKHYPDWEAVKAQIDMGQLKEYTKGRLKNEKVFELLEKM